MKKFVYESWNEYITFFKKGIKDKKKVKWIFLLIGIIELFLLIFTFYGGYKIFNYLKG